MIHAAIERYSYSPIPLDHPDRETWGVAVERAAPRRWAIRNLSHCLNRISGEWEYEPLPSSRTDEWLEAHRWTQLEEAQLIAARVCGSVTWNGTSAEEIAARLEPPFPGGTP
jgi:hypothetical protein